MAAQTRSWTCQLEAEFRFKSRLNEAQTHLSASLADGITADRQVDVMEDGTQRPDSWKLRQDGDLGGWKEEMRHMAPSTEGKRGRRSQPSKQKLNRPSLLN